ncbi:hypothetical protein CAI21_15085 [Alkalilimnicola ehrlichii]|uniref:Uncharacterized protein n=1 Tax=Alkalilimnicola ehrlichii TaxID=351052 RepID=A0A3E0WTQ9_9GAMM|nr:Rid family hydrolase [Alkalilimnicola ehrlichii]RFA27173.1 hypothetical protein CAI21_15085 [Alkalilimnicola ehrlichii]RFA35347.1 hypothetical protein CAL65_12745 [Alkalilimnicola ehrlichii]
MQRNTLDPDTVFNTRQYGFSQAVVVPDGKRVLLSGQVGVDADEKTVSATLGGQTQAAIDNIEAILSTIGGTLAHVVFLRIYIVQSAKNEQDAIAEALLKNFPTQPPATSWLLVDRLSEPEWLIEIEAEAVLPA